MKDGSFLVVTPSSIPRSATRGADADLSLDEGSEDFLEDLEDEPVMKTRVSDVDKNSDGDEQEAVTMGMCSSFLLSLIFLLFLLFLSISLYTFHMLFLPCGH